MTPEQRVLTACAFKTPDRIPRFDNFWKFPESWRNRLGSPEMLTDVRIWYPDETPFRSKARFLKESGDYRYEVDAWGRSIRSRKDAYFYEVLETPFKNPKDINRIVFDSPESDERYLTGKMDPSITYGSLKEAENVLMEDKSLYCVFGKTGGPYLRSTYLRGETQFLLDMAADPILARAIADRITEHMMTVGLQEIKRWGLTKTGIWIYDDMAFNMGPMFSPSQFECILLPAYRQMIQAYKGAGAAYVFLHSDGDIRLLLDMLVDAGIDGINPIERRAGMNMVFLRKKYPKLILTGGMCNTSTLINGTEKEIRKQTMEIIELGKNGGVIIGTHSVSPEIPLEKFLVYHETCIRHGFYSL